MRSIISFEMSKGADWHTLQLVPIPNAPKYQILIDGQLRYLGSGFRLDEGLERLAVFERSGFQVWIVSRRTKGLLKKFKRKSDKLSVNSRGGTAGRPKKPARKTRGVPIQRSLFD